MADNEDGPASKVDEAVEFLRQAADAESTNRVNGLFNLQFSYGDEDAHWPLYATAGRGLNRPKFVINETGAYVRKVTNAQRKARPRGKASPVDNFADKKVAKVITGLGRHIEVQSDADNAYDTAFNFAARVGWGYWRLRTDYVSSTSFDQEIYIDVIDNPFSVYFDPNSRLPDGSDACKALITSMMGKEAFKAEYPGAKLDNFTDQGTGDSPADWMTEKDIRLAEYYCLQRKKARLVMLTDGTPVWEDDLPPMELLQQAGIGIKGDRESFRETVKWRKQTCYDILDEKDMPGRFGKWIPVIPVYWTDVVIDSRRIKQGMVKDMVDPARMVDFWQTSITETLAMAPKPKWLIAEGQDEGHENEFNQANVSPMAALRYKPTDVEGKPVPPPQRIAPEPPPAGFIEAAFLASQNLSRVAGVFDPAVRGGAQHKSDATLNAEAAQGDLTNFDGYDNLIRSIKHTWRIMLDWIPDVYDTQRVLRIIGEDGRETLETINQRQQVQEQKPDGTVVAVEKVLNDVTVGQYDVVMEVGPGYDTQRKEGVAAMIELMATPLGEKVAAVADDLIVRSMDFPGSDLIADRLAAANPLSQIDEKSDIPPQAQMKMAALQKQLKDAQGIIQQQGLALKYRSDVEQMKQEGETRRTLMKVTGDAHDTEQRSLSMQHSTEVKSLTDQNVAEIDGLVKLLLAHVDTRHLEMEIAQRDRQQQAKHDENAQAQSATVQ